MQGSGCSEGELAATKGISDFAVSADFSSVVRGWRLSTTSGCSGTCGSSSWTAEMSTKMVMAV